nr:photosystem I assembly protein Ycf4 [Silene lithophila]YP_010829382.1 photosystem I assembly protein Ycf4 [Silene alexandrae]WFF47412.1 photosystem I assembly protein Ycf4 [Silene lithophila]WFF48081.1 photosystem I assembly protein Ycf4 [Silene alexandrae]
MNCRSERIWIELIRGSRKISNLGLVVFINEKILLETIYIKFE